MLPHACTGALASSGSSRGGPLLRDLPVLPSASGGASLRSASLIWSSSRACEAQIVAKATRTSRGNLQAADRRSSTSASSDFCSRPSTTRNGAQDARREVYDDRAVAHPSDRLRQERPTSSSATQTAPATATAAANPRLTARLVMMAAENAACLSSKQVKDLVFAIRHASEDPDRRLQLPPAAVDRLVRELRSRRQLAVLHDLPEAVWGTAGERGARGDATGSASRLTPAHGGLATASASAQSGSGGPERPLLLRRRSSDNPSEEAAAVRDNPLTAVGAIGGSVWAVPADVPVLAPAVAAAGTAGDAGGDSALDVKRRRRRLTATARTSAGAASAGTSQTGTAASAANNQPHPHPHPHADAPQQQRQQGQDTTQGQAQQQRHRSDDDDGDYVDAADEDSAELRRFFDELHLVGGRLPPAEALAALEACTVVRAVPQRDTFEALLRTVRRAAASSVAVAGGGFVGGGGWWAGTAVAGAVAARGADGGSVASTGAMAGTGVAQAPLQAPVQAPVRRMGWRAEEPLPERWAQERQVGRSSTSSGGPAEVGAAEGEGGRIQAQQGLPLERTATSRRYGLAQGEALQQEQEQQQGEEDDGQQQQERQERLLQSPPRRRLAPPAAVFAAEDVSANFPAVSPGLQSTLLPSPSLPPPLVRPQSPPCAPDPACHAPPPLPFPPPLPSPPMPPSPSPYPSTVLPPTRVVAVLHGLTRLGQRLSQPLWRELLAYLQPSLSFHQPRLPSQPSHQHHHSRHHPHRPQQPHPQQPQPQHLPLSHYDLVDLASAMAAAGCNPSTPFLAAHAAAVMGWARQLTGRQAARLLWAYASLDYCPPPGMQSVLVATLRAQVMEVADPGELARAAAALVLLAQGHVGVVAEAMPAPGTHASSTDVKSSGGSGAAGAATGLAPFRGGTHQAEGLSPHLLSAAEACLQQHRRACHAKRTALRQQRLRQWEAQRLREDRGRGDQEQRGQYWRQQPRLQAAGPAAAGQHLQGILPLDDPWAWVPNVALFHGGSMDTTNSSSSSSASRSGDRSTGSSAYSTHNGGSGSDTGGRRGGGGGMMVTAALAAAAAAAQGANADAAAAHGHMAGQLRSLREQEGLMAWLAAIALPADEAEAAAAAYAASTPRGSVAAAAAAAATANTSTAGASSGGIPSVGFASSSPTGSSPGLVLRIDLGTASGPHGTAAPGTTTPAPPLAPSCPLSPPPLPEPMSADGISTVARLLCARGRPVPDAAWAARFLRLVGPLAADLRPADVFPTAQLLCRLYTAHPALLTAAGIAVAEEPKGSADAGGTPGAVAASPPRTARAAAAAADATATRARERGEVGFSLGPEAGAGLAAEPPLRALLETACGSLDRLSYGQLVGLHGCVAALASEPGVRAWLREQGWLAARTGSSIGSSSLSDGSCLEGAAAAARSRGARRSGARGTGARGGSPPCDAALLALAVAAQDGAGSSGEDADSSSSTSSSSDRVAASGGADPAAMLMALLHPPRPAPAVSARATRRGVGVAAAARAQAAPPPPSLPSPGSSSSSLDNSSIASPTAYDRLAQFAAANHGDQVAATVTSALEQQQQPATPSLLPALHPSSPPPPPPHPTNSSNNIPGPGPASSAPTSSASSSSTAAAALHILTHLLRSCSEARVSLPPQQLLAMRSTWREQLRLAPARQQPHATSQTGPLSASAATGPGHESDTSAADTEPRKVAGSGQQRPARKQELAAVDCQGQRMAAGPGSGWVALVDPRAVADLLLAVAAAAPRAEQERNAAVLELAAALGAGGEAALRELPGPQLAACLHVTAVALGDGPAATSRGGGGGEAGGGRDGRTAVAAAAARAAAVTAVVEPLLVEVQRRATLAPPPSYSDDNANDAGARPPLPLSLQSWVLVFRSLARLSYSGPAWPQRLRLREAAIAAAARAQLTAAGSAANGGPASATSATGAILGHALASQLSNLLSTQYSAQPSAAVVRYCIWVLRHLLSPPSPSPSPSSSPASPSSAAPPLTAAWLHRLSTAGAARHLRGLHPRAAADWLALCAAHGRAPPPPAMRQAWTQLRRAASAQLLDSRQLCRAVWSAVRLGLRVPRDVLAAACETAASVAAQTRPPASGTTGKQQHQQHQHQQEQQAQHHDQQQQQQQQHQLSILASDAVRLLWAVQYDDRYTPPLPAATSLCGLLAGAWPVLPPGERSAALWALARLPRPGAERAVRESGLGRAVVAQLMHSSAGGMGRGRTRSPSRSRSPSGSRSGNRSSSGREGRLGRGGLWGAAAVEVRTPGLAAAVAATPSHTQQQAVQKTAAAEATDTAANSPPDFGMASAVCGSKATTLLRPPPPLPPLVRPAMPGQVETQQPDTGRLPLEPSANDLARVSWALAKLRQPLPQSLAEHLCAHLASAASATITLSVAAAPAAAAAAAASVAGSYHGGDEDWEEEEEADQPNGLDGGGGADILGPKEAVQALFAVARILPAGGGDGGGVAATGRVLAPLLRAALAADPATLDARCIADGLGTLSRQRRALASHRAALRKEQELEQQQQRQQQVEQQQQKQQRGRQQVHARRATPVTAAGSSSHSTTVTTAKPIASTSTASGSSTGSGWGADPWVLAVLERAADLFELSAERGVGDRPTPAWCVLEVLQAAAFLEAPVSLRLAVAAAEVLEMHLPEMAPAELADVVCICASGEGSGALSSGRGGSGRGCGRGVAAEEPTAGAVKAKWVVKEEAEATLPVGLAWEALRRLVGAEAEARGTAAAGGAVGSEGPGVESWGDLLQPDELARVVMAAPAALACEVRAAQLQIQQPQQEVQQEVQQQQQQGQQCKAGLWGKQERKLKPQQQPKLAKQAQQKQQEAQQKQKGQDEQLQEQLQLLQRRRLMSSYVMALACRPGDPRVVAMSPDQLSMLVHGVVAAGVAPGARWLGWVSELLRRRVRDASQHGLLRMAAALVRAEHWPGAAWGESCLQQASWLVKARRAPATSLRQLQQAVSELRAFDTTVAAAAATAAAADTDPPTPHQLHHQHLHDTDTAAETSMALSDSERALLCNNSSSSDGSGSSSSGVAASSMQLSELLESEVSRIMGLARGLHNAFTAATVAVLRSPSPAVLSIASPAATTNSPGPTHNAAAHPSAAGRSTSRRGGSTTAAATAAAVKIAADVSGGVDSGRSGRGVPALRPDDPLGRLLLVYRLTEARVDQMMALTLKVAMLQSAYTLHMLHMQQRSLQPQWQQPETMLTSGMATAATVDSGFMGVGNGPGFAVPRSSQVQWALQSPPVQPSAAAQAANAAAQLWPGMQPGVGMGAGSGSGTGMGSGGVALSAASWGLEGSFALGSFMPPQPAGSSLRVAPVSLAPLATYLMQLSPSEAPEGSSRLPAHPNPRLYAPGALPAAQSSPSSQTSPGASAPATGVASSGGRTAPAARVGRATRSVSLAGRVRVGAGAGAGRAGSVRLHRSRRGIAEEGEGGESTETAAADTLMGLQVGSDEKLLVSLLHIRYCGMVCGRVYT